jgi:Tfp pilus assembly protein PilF
MTQARNSSAALARALAHLESRDWQAAHEIVQHDKSELAAWLHGIVHTIEGDLENARYWYRRIHRAFPGPEAVAAEIARARQALDGEAGHAKERA